MMLDLALPLFPPGAAQWFEGIPSALHNPSAHDSFFSDSAISLTQNLQLRIKKSLLR